MLPAAIVWTGAAEWDVLRRLDMALVDCPECQKPVSTQATACPHCGAPGPAGTATPPSKTSSGLWKVALFVGVLIVGGCVALFIQSIPDLAKTTSVGQARLRVIVNKESYGYGYLTVVGTVENIGDSGAYSPSLKVSTTSYRGSGLTAAIAGSQRMAFSSRSRPAAPGVVQWNRSVTVATEERSAGVH